MGLMKGSRPRRATILGAGFAAGAGFAVSGAPPTTRGLSAFDFLGAGFPAVVFAAGAGCFVVAGAGFVAAGAVLDAVAVVGFFAAAGAVTGAAAGFFVAAGAAAGAAAGFFVAVFAADAAGFFVGAGACAVVALAWPAGLFAGAVGVCAQAAQAAINSRIKLVLGLIVPSTSWPARPGPELQPELVPGFPV